MAEPPTLKSVKLWGPRGSLPYCRRMEIVIDQGRKLECFKTWPKLEIYLSAVHTLFKAHCSLASLSNVVKSHFLNRSWLAVYSADCFRVNSI